MITGTINWYDNESRKGCIISDDRVWYRISEFVRPDLQLNPGTRVSFELSESSVNPIVVRVKAQESGAV